LHDGAEDALHGCYGDAMGRSSGSTTGAALLDGARLGDQRTVGSSGEWIVQRQVPPDDGGPVAANRGRLRRQSQAHGCI
jgi:hypothetical protein